MIIKNNTASPLDLHRRDRNLFYLVTIPAGATQEVSPTCSIGNLEDLKRYGKVSIVDPTAPCTVETTPIEKAPTKVEEKITEEVAEEESPVEDETPKATGKFICEECKTEFASARGLTSHMKRVHGVESEGGN